MKSRMYNLLAVCLLTAPAFAQSGNLGAFANSGDVGGPAKKGSAQFDSANGEYRITGSGANIWGKADQFQYVWREMPGNFTVTAREKSTARRASWSASLWTPIRPMEIS